MPGSARPAWCCYDVSTLYFETDEGDGFREPGFSKERRLEPQITIGLLTDQAGFPLMVSAFEGNKAETTTMLPVIQSFMSAHNLPDVTVVADAGMLSEANQKAIEAAGPVVHPRHEDPARSLRRGAVAARAPRRGDPGRARVHPAVAGRVDRQAAATRSSTTSTAPTGPAGRCAASTSRSARPSRPSRARCRSSATGSSPCPAAPKSVNRELEEKARALAGLKGYITNLGACPDGTPVTAEFVIGAYHQLFQIEKSFRMSKRDLQARPIYDRTSDSIEAHLTIVFAALAVTRWIEPQTGWSIPTSSIPLAATAPSRSSRRARPHRRRPTPRRSPPGYRRESTAEQVRTKSGPTLPLAQGSAPTNCA